MALAAPALAESELVRRAQSGDRAAFGSLYETYLTPIYDFTLGMVRNRADAEDVTSAAFLKAVERLPGLRDPSAFKGWLYSIARHSALDLINSRKRVVPVAEHFDSATTVDAPPVPHPADRAEQQDMRELFDMAASTLSERERTVYDLTVRHGVGSAEVAEVLNVRPAYAYILVNRLKGSVTEALEAVALARVGRNDCPGLADVLSRFGEDVSPRMRKAVSRHAKSCDKCEETKRHRASVPALVAGMAFAQPAAAFAAELTSRIDTHWQQHTPTGPASSAGGLAHVVSVVATLVVISGAVMGLSAQRTIVPGDEGPTQAVEVTDDAPSTEPEDQAPVREPSADGRPAPDTDGGSSVVVNEGANAGGSGGDGDDSSSADATDEPSDTPSGGRTHRSGP